MVTWSQEAFIAALGVSLAHSLWQGAVLGGVGLALNGRLKRVPPDVRHGVYCLLLLTIFVAWLCSLGYLYLAGTRLGAPSSNAHAAAAIGIPAGPLLTPAAGRTPTDLLWACSPTLVALWTLGVGLLCLRHLGSLFVLHRLRVAGTSPCPPEWCERIRMLALRLGLRRVPTVRLSIHVDVPLTFGTFKACVLIPPSALMGLAPDQLEALLAHELAHIRRNDALINLVQICVETVLFYHPAVWWLSSQIRTAREQRCDDLALQVVGDRALYARALVSMEELRTTIPHLALAANGGTLKMTRSRLIHRIQRVLNVAVPEKHAPLTSGAIALCTVLVGLATLWPVQAHSATPQPLRSDNPAGQSAAQDPTPTRKTTLKLNINGTSYTLHTLDITPDTPVKVNGEDKRFGDLSGEEQEAIRDAVKTAQEAPQDKANARVERKTVLKLNINGTSYTLHTFDITPDTPVTVNGTDKRFGDLDGEEQQAVRQAVDTARSEHADSDISTGSHVETTVKATKTNDGVKRMVTKRVTRKVYVFKLGADTATIYGDLKPDTIVAINGVKSKFKALPASRQKQLQEAMSHIGTPSK